MLDWSFTLFRCVFLSHYVSVWGYVHMCTGAWEGQKRDQCFTPAVGSSLGWEPGSGNKILVSCRSTKHSPYTSSLAPTFTFGKSFRHETSFFVHIELHWLLPFASSLFPLEPAQPELPVSVNWVLSKRCVKPVSLASASADSQYHICKSSRENQHCDPWTLVAAPFSFLGSEVIQLCQTLTQST